jgi:hypothetical protein
LRTGRSRSAATKSGAGTVAAQSATVLDLTPSCPDCELTLQEVLFMSSEREELGPVMYTANATVDAQGRFWISYGTAGVPQAFSPADGGLVENIGRRGEGPGEFMAATLLLPAGDSVLVFDKQIQRMTVIGPDLEDSPSARRLSKRCGYHMAEGGPERTRLDARICRAPLPYREPRHR